MNTLFLIIIALTAYFLGGLNGAIISSRYIWKKDIRDFGSGNAGLTNFYRTFGVGGIVVVLAVDIIKTVIAVLIGGWLMGKQGYPMVGKLFAGFCVMLGHSYPALYQLKGGKGVLCACVIAMMVDWRVCLICIVTFLVVVIFTRYVSLGSIAACIVFPVALLIGKALGLEITGLEIFLGTLCVVLALINHRTNIARLMLGNENRFEINKRRSPQ